MQRRFGWPEFGSAWGDAKSAPPPDPETAPVRVSAPVISGDLLMGSTLTLDPPPVYTGNPAPAVTWRWQARVPPSGSITTIKTGGNLTLTAAQLGMSLRLQDQATNSVGTSAWASGNWSAIVMDPTTLRAASPASDTVLFAGHSLLQTPWGGETVDGHHGGILYSDWPGATLSDFVGYGSARQVWDLNGHARNGAYDQIIVTDLTLDFTNGYPAMDSARGIETLQTLYWFGLEAQARGAELILYQHWATGQAPLTQNLDETYAYCAAWLEAHLDIRVFIVPASRFVGRMLEAYPAAEVYAPDQVHLSFTDAKFARGTSYLVYSFLTHQRCPFVRAGEEDLDQMAWEVLQVTRRAGFGGTIGYDAPTLADPLPSPAAS